MIAWKLIKPQRLRTDAFRLKMLNAARKAGAQIKQDFEKTVATWDKKPVFQIEVSLTGPGPIIEVWTDSEIYRYVDEGTKAHDIWAGFYTGKSSKRVLAFQEDYTAKTTPGVIGSTSGGSSGDMVFRPYVRHPGTKARQFSKTIAKAREPWFKRQIEQAMSEAVRESGFSLTS